MAERGYLLIADITGYTRFLTGSELEHAQGILESLFAVILERLKSPLVLSNIQGDAFFAFADDAAVHASGQILDSIEALYFGFQDRVLSMRENTTCQCRACGNIGNLDLKFIVHHGAYVINEIAGRHELTGADVILLHRLLKNDVTDRTGIRAYALFTSAALDALALDELRAETRPYAIELSEFGTVNGAVLDMGQRWQSYHASKEIVVSGDQPLIFEPVTRLIPFPIETVWHGLADAESRPRWQPGVRSVNRLAGDPRRLRTGAVEHCSHGKEAVDLNYVDVRPLKHMTGEARMPLGGRVRFSLLTAPEGEGTRVTVRFAQPESANPLARLVLKGMMSLQAGKLRAFWVDGLQQLEALIGERARREAPVRPRAVDAAVAARALVAEPQAV